jgi:SAM-dependent methyltransferase
MAIDPQASDAELARIYGADYFLESDQDQASDVKRRTARFYLGLAARRGVVNGRLLDVGCGNGELLVEAAARGFDVAGLDVSTHAVATTNARLGRSVAVAGFIEDGVLPDASFDVLIATDVVEHTRDPHRFLAALHRALKPNGILLLATPDLASWHARLMGRSWYEFKTEHLHYFTGATLETALVRAGFRGIERQPARKILTLDYLHRHFQRFPVALLTPLVAAGARLLPATLRHRPIGLPTGSVIGTARAAVVRARPLVSVIVPVYNEVSTVRTLLAGLLAKTLAGADKEIIIVEDQSTDGSREEVCRYADTPGVRLLLGDRPRGKGAAVRRGLAQATGDIVLIQDADLEYSLDDYDALLEPIIAGRRLVVLGSRHDGSMRIRSFTHQPLLAVFFNSGHVLLTWLFNVLYRQRLKDPWTMFKVFRMECLSRLDFECRRFNFDVELMAKLVRKGYRPVELPVTYRSRSFHEGKKVGVFRDPMTWIWACLKYRVVSPFATEPAARAGEAAGE